MSKARSIFRCAECGGASPKWVGRCPSCAEWNTLVEELDVPTPRRRRGSARPSTAPFPSPRSTPTSGSPAPPVCPRSIACSAAASCRARSRWSAASPASASPRCCSRSPRRWPDRGRRCSTCRPRSPSSRCGCGPSGSAPSRPACTSPARRRCPTCVAHLDDVSPTCSSSTPSRPSTSPSSSSAPGLGRPGARVRGPAGAPGQGAIDRTVLVGHVTKDGALAGPAGARARGRHGAGVRGRAPPRAAPAAGLQAPLRLHRRARPVRDDRHRPGAGARRQRPVPRRPPHRRVRFGRRAHDRRAIGRCWSRCRPWSSASNLPSPRRSAQGVDSGRLSLLLAVLDRRAAHPGRQGATSTSLAVGGVRSCASPAPTSGWPWPSRRPPPAGRCRPTSWSCGEVGLGGELRQVAPEPAPAGRGGPARVHRGHRPPARARAPARHRRPRGPTTCSTPSPWSGLTAVSPVSGSSPRCSDPFREPGTGPARRPPGCAGSTDYTPAVARRRSDALLDALGTVAPGKPLREGLDRILQAKMGALIVVGDGPEVLNICSGGFLLDAAFSPQRLSELAKMDGAIILAPDASRIARANVHLVPNPNVPDLGDRHPPPHRRAGGPLHQGAGDLGVRGHGHHRRATSATRSTRSSPSLACSTGPTRPCRPSSATRTGSTRCRRPCPRSRSRTSSRSATSSCCCSAPRWSCASPRRSTSTSSSSASTAGSCGSSSRR